MKTLQCRAHGGTFKIGPKRGRDPVNCGGKWPECSRVTGDNPVDMKRIRVPKLTEEESLARRMADSAAIRGTSQPKPTGETPWIEAQVRLEEQGWLTSGKGRVTEPSEFLSFPNGRQMSGGRFQIVTLTAVREDELLIMVWADGELVQQTYSLWHEKPSANGKPAGNLTFDPDECTDRELVRALGGMKCTWWNVLGQKEETAVIDAESIKIEHSYNGKGDESPGDRIVKFIERGAGGFRAFRVAALLKVG